MEVSNAAKLNGLLMKTNSDPELKINLDENTFHKFSKTSVFEKVTRR